MKRLIKRVILGVKAGVGRTRPKSWVVVVTAPRTGSYMLCGLLEQLRGVGFCGEILSPGNSVGIRAGSSKRKVLGHFRRSMMANFESTVVSKVMVSHLRAHGISISDLLALNPRLSLVILFRRDALAQFASFEKAKADGVWIVDKKGCDSEAKQGLEIDSVALSSWLSQNVSGFNDVMDAARSAGIRPTVLAYEDLVQDRKGLFQNELLPLLNMPVGTTVPSPKTIQKTSATTKENVKNYDGLLSELGGAFEIAFKDDKFHLEVV